MVDFSVISSTVENSVVLSAILGCGSVLALVGFGLFASHKVGRFFDFRDADRLERAAGIADDSAARNRASGNVEWALNREAVAANFRAGAADLRAGRYQG